MTPSKILNHVARIARVPKVHRPAFVRNLRGAIKRAEKDMFAPKGKRVSAGALRKDFFAPIIQAAGKLQAQLGRLDGENLKTGESARSMAANHFFSEALLSRTKSDDFEDAIGDLIRSLNLALVIDVSERAGARAKSWLAKPGRKKGTGYAAFDMFVMTLLVAAETIGGSLTLYKTQHKAGLWGGSLVAAMTALKPLLPKSRFFPASKTALNTVYQRWRSETGKSPRKKV